MQRSICLIAHDMRSTHNVGSLLRTAEGLGVQHVYLTGYSPYPKKKGDKRLPHMSEKMSRQISKTALGAEHSQPWSQYDDVNEVIKVLQQQQTSVIALEQTPNAVDITKYKPPKSIAIILGREVEGLEDTIIKQCDGTIFIPMFGKKESFNVVQAAAMALFYCRFYK